MSMHFVSFVILLASTVCLAHFRTYDSRNLIEREEPQSDMEGVIVECPVCENSFSYILPHEECDILKGNKRYKRCHMGTYENEVCGNRMDCYRGPGEQCTEKMDYDVYGQKCAHGYICDDTMHVCIGLGHTPNSRQRYLLSKIYGYPLRAKQQQISE